MSNTNKKTNIISSPSSLAKFLGLSTPEKNTDANTPASNTNNLSEITSTSQKVNIRKQPYEKSCPITRAHAKKLKQDSSTISTAMDTDNQNPTHASHLQQTNISNSETDLPITEMEILSTSPTSNKFTLHDNYIEITYTNPTPTLSRENNTPDFATSEILDKGKELEIPTENNWTLVTSTK
jgi:hypothetical protein